MEEGNKKIVFFKKKYRKDKNGVFSKVIRAGQRTYFFDIMSSPHEDTLVTITESKRKVNSEGRYFYEKHKIYLYREDFEKFVEGLNAVFEHILTQFPSNQPVERRKNSNFEDAETNEVLTNYEEPEAEPSYTHLDFEDLDEKR